MKKRMLSLAVVCLLSIFTSKQAAAEEIYNVPNDSYTYHDGYPVKQDVVSRAAFEVESVLDGAALGTTPMQNPSDICVSPDGNIYLLDGGNSRILVLDGGLKLIRIIDELHDKKETLKFSGARGLFINRDGLLYIADTRNRRILLSDSNGEVQKIFTLPDSDIIPPDFNFAPIKVAEDNRSFVYILSGGSYYGALVFRTSGEFFGFYAANSVSGSVLSWFGKLSDLLFSSEQKRAYSVQRLPYQFTNLCVDDEGFLYTVTCMTSTIHSNRGQIRKISPGGNNILTWRSGYRRRSADSFNFGDEGYAVNSLGRYSIQNLTDIAADRLGFIYAVDSTYGKVFVYDNECNTLSIFGGGMGTGNQAGTFVMPEALEVIGGRVLVVDSQTNRLTVFKMTGYGSLLLKADSYTLVGDYAAAKPIWQSVLRMDRNNQLAYRGLARAYILEGDYHKAMRYSKIGLDQETYAQAFKQSRAFFIQDNFWWLFLLAAAAVGGLLAFLIYTSKRNIVLIRHEKTRTMLNAMVHPFEACNRIREKNLGSIGLAWAVLLVYFLIRIATALYGGFMYRIPDPYSFNAFFILLGSVGLVLLWTIVNWGVCTLFEGKGQVRQIFIVSCYSLLPQILYGLLYLTLSHIVLPEEAGALGILSTAAAIATVSILVIGMMEFHEFGFTRTVGTGLLTVVGIGLVIFIIMMMFILSQNLISFIGTIFYEVLYR